MSTRLKYPDLFQLPPEEKWQLAQELFDDVTDFSPSLTLSPEVKAELDRRREEYLRDPSTAISVDEAFDELMSDRV
jgi:putative addiction module component (TIGR02574 family)